MNEKGTGPSCSTWAAPFGLRWRMSYMRHARRKMTELAGAPLQVEDFYQLVEDRYESYRRWALGENKEAGDRELVVPGGCCRTMTRPGSVRCAMS